MMRPLFLKDLKKGHDGSNRRVGRNDFLRLGLRKCEARIEVIRTAATQAVLDVRETYEYEDLGDQQKRLAAIATSTYRLLDPRRRSSMVERVQLILIPEPERNSTAEIPEVHLSDNHPDVGLQDRRQSVGQKIIPSRALSAGQFPTRERASRTNSFDVLAAQDVIELLRTNDRNARIRRLMLASLVAISLLAVALLLFAKLGLLT